MCKHLQHCCEVLSPLQQRCDSECVPYFCSIVFAWPSCDHHTAHLSASRYLSAWHCIRCSAHRMRKHLQHCQVHQPPAAALRLRVTSHSESACLTFEVLYSHGHHVTIMRLAALHYSKGHLGMHCQHACLSGHALPACPGMHCLWHPSTFVSHLIKFQQHLALPRRDLVKIQTPTCVLPQPRFASCYPVCELL